ncbi:MAG: ABC transporter ATP-binding protein [Gemmatimonadota bacterium]|nr:ABC transporter ATP-binding protein [Gemmatimonadota bacterium]
MIDLKGIDHKYGSNTVLGIESLTLKPGTITGLVGPNGSGKSTLLRILALLERPDNGEISIDGTPIVTSAQRRRSRRGITLVEQRPFLFAGDVRSNMAYGLQRRRIDKGEAEKRILESLETLGITHLLERRVKALSEGERQQVAIARAVSLEPDILLLDEPTSAADRRATNVIYTALESQRSKGVTICFASHELENAYRFSNNLLSLAHGRIVPTTPENIFRVDLPNGHGSKTVQLNELSIQVVTEKEGPATIAISPDDFLVSTEPFQSSARNQFPGRVTSLSDDGHDRVTLVVNAGPEFVVRLTPTAVKDLSISLGSEVFLSVKAVAVRVH